MRVPIPSVMKRLAMKAGLHSSVSQVWHVSKSIIAIATWTEAFGKGDLHELIGCHLHKGYLSYLCLISLTQVIPIIQSVSWNTLWLLSESIIQQQVVSNFPSKTWRILISTKSHSRCVNWGFVYIPQFGGGVGSLNVACACSVVPRPTNPTATHTHTIVEEQKRCIVIVCSSAFPAIKWHKNHWIGMNWESSHQLCVLFFVGRSFINSVHGLPPL